MDRRAGDRDRPRRGAPGRGAALGPFTNLHRWVRELPGFTDEPGKSNEKVLEAIQMAWLDEVED